MKRLFIVGCSGHGKVAADIAAKMQRYEKILFLDDNPKGESCLGYPVVGDSRYEDILPDDEAFIAVGNSQIREMLMNQFEKRKIPLAILIHPDAVIAAKVSIGTGTIIMAGAVINPDTKIGRGIIINTGATVDHDNCIDNYSHISVGAHLAGTVTVGKHVWIGAGAVVSNNLSICDNVMIGAGTVVVKNIDLAGTYIGVPARNAK